MFLYFLPFLLVGRRGLSLHPISIMKPAAVFFIFFQYTSNAQYIVAILISRCSCTKLCYCHINMKTTQDNSQMSVVHSDLSLSHELKFDCVSKRCQRGTLWGSEHRNTAKKFGKYSNTAKKFPKYRNTSIPTGNAMLYQNHYSVC